MRIKKSQRFLTEDDEKCSTFRITRFIDESPNKPINGKPYLKKYSKGQNGFYSKHTLIGGRCTVQNLHDTSSLMTIVRLDTQHLNFAEIIIQYLYKRDKFNLERKHKETFELLYVLQMSYRKIQIEVFCYGKVEEEIKKMNVLVKKIGAEILVYRTYAFSGMAFFYYSNYSLAVFCFDKCLKVFYDRDCTRITKFYRQFEAKIYKCLARIFLSKYKYLYAKGFAYKYLRKCWALDNIDYEIIAYDMLGQVYLYLGNVYIGRYFHSRLQSGQRECKELMMISKQEMEKVERYKIYYVCFESINVFTDRDARFHEMLENFYKVRSIEWRDRQKQVVLDNKENKNSPYAKRPLFIYTHRSPNRILNNYYKLYRRLIYQKSSKYLHFIRPSESNRLRKLFIEYYIMLNEIIQRYNYIKYIVPSEFKIFTNEDDFIYYNY